MAWFGQEVAIGGHWWKMLTCPNRDFEEQVVSFAVNPGWFSFYSLVSEWIVLKCVGSFILAPPWNGVPCKLSYLNVSLACFAYHSLPPGLCVSGSADAWGVESTRSYYRKCVFPLYTYAPVISTNIHLLPEGIFFFLFFNVTKLPAFVILVLWPLSKIVTENTWVLAL